MDGAGGCRGKAAGHAGVVSGEERKRRRVRSLQRYLLNPPVMLAVWAGLVPGYVLIETSDAGRGQRRRTVVGMDIEGSTGWVVAEQGRHAGYVRTSRRTRMCGCASAADGAQHARASSSRTIPRRLRAFNRPTLATSVRRFGTDLASVRFDFMSG